MAWERRVVWSEGMMLQPHHFQQQTRYHESQLRNLLNVCSSSMWGIYDISFDEALLKVGKVTINSAQGILPDGSYFHIPSIDEQPATIELSNEHLNATLYLSVLLRKQGNIETSRDSQRKSRFSLGEYEARDISGSSQKQTPIEVSGLSFSLRTSVDDNSEYSCIAVAQVDDISPSGAIGLKSNFIGPCLNIKSNNFIQGFLVELSKLTKHRIQSLASRVSVAGKSTGSEILEYMMLQSLNKHYPMLVEYEQKEHLTPFQLYEKLVTLIGDLSTFVTTEKSVPDLPRYDHAKPEPMFLDLMKILREYYSYVLEQNSINIPLVEKKFGIRVGTISDKSLFDNATFVLAISADTSHDDIRKYFPQQAKIGAVEQIKELVNVQLPGIQLTSLATAPREMPYQRNFVYFELVQNGEYWNALTISGGIAIHVSTSFPNLSMELWAIRGN